jgi:hypothetical protein
MLKIYVHIGTDLLYCQYEVATVLAREMLSRTVFVEDWPEGLLDSTVAKGINKIPLSGMTWTGESVLLCPVLTHCD